MLYILILIDPRKAMMYSGALMITACLYFLASLVSTLIEQEFQNIALSLYQSKWYLLAEDQCKMVTMIQMISQKAKAVKVGPFTTASLERFTFVSFAFLDLKVRKQIEK